MNGQGRQSVLAPAASQSLADVLERVLDQGIVVAGDIQVRLLDLELLTIKIRLVICSVERAREMGMDWWTKDSFLHPGRPESEEETRALRERLEVLERRLGEEAAHAPA